MRRRSGLEGLDHPIDFEKRVFVEDWEKRIFVIHAAKEELDAATAQFREDPAAPLPQVDSPDIDDHVIRYLRDGDSPRRGPATARFALGDTVTVRNPPAADHTRLPGYLRGHGGTVERIFEGNYAYFFSAGADGLGDPVPVYLVRLEPAVLWGATAEAGAGPLYAEIYEPYLSEGDTTS